MPHHGELVLVVTDRNLYVVDAATFGAMTAESGEVRRVQAEEGCTWTGGTSGKPL